MGSPETVEEVKSSLLGTMKGEISQKFENYITVLVRDPVFKNAIKTNLMTERVEIVKEVGWKRSGTVLTDNDLRYIRFYLEKNYDLVNPKTIQEAVELVANEQKFHPICELLESLKWDGVERIKDMLHHFLGVKSDEYAYEVLKLFLIGCIKRVYEPGCKFDYMLCLVGGQGAGKSSFFRLLAIMNEWFSDDLKKLDDDNVYRKMQGHWIMEMSEMLSIGTAKSTDEIKSFLSRQKENYKDPYDKYAKDRHRQCVFGGTTNRQDFLPLDRTGNRRFLPVLVDMDNAETHILTNEADSRKYIMQVWAEAMVLYQNNDYAMKFPEHLEEQLLAIQKECMPDDSLAGMVQVFLDDYKGDYVCSVQLYEDALKNKYDKPKAKDLKDINDVMNNSVIGWRKCKSQRRLDGYGQQRAWERIKPLGSVNETSSLSHGFEPVTEQMNLPFD